MEARVLRRVFLVFLCAAALSGCSGGPAPLYYWGNYESQVYSYLSGERRENQIEALSADLEKAESDAKALPPGFYAQLGLLYMEAGDDAAAIVCFRTEKERFPESAAYMDFLLGNYGK